MVDTDKEKMKRRFSERLYRLRSAIGVSQDALAKALNVSRAAIGYYENGERLPDIEFLDRINWVTGCSLDYLLGRSDLMTSPPEYAYNHELSDNQTMNIEALLNTNAFKAFIDDKATVDFFRQLELSAFIGTYGDDERARAIVEFMALPSLGRVIGDVYFHCLGRVRDEQWKRLTIEQRDKIASEYERLRERAHNIVTDSNARRKRYANDDFVSGEQTDQSHVVTDPIELFKNKMIFADQSKEAATDGKETR